MFGHTWGEFSVVTERKFRDVMFVIVIKADDGHVERLMCEWDWQETETSDKTGVSVELLEWLLANSGHDGVDRLYMSTGVSGQLHVAAATLAKAESKGIEVVTMRTPDIVRLINTDIATKPAAGIRVIAAFLHSTS